MPYKGYIYERDLAHQTQHTIKVPEDGIELNLDCGLNIYVYYSRTRSKFVVELETGDTTDQSGELTIQHDDLEQPRMTVMINEAEISDD